MPASPPHDDAPGRPSAVPMNSPIQLSLTPDRSPPTVAADGAVGPSPHRVGEPDATFTPSVPASGGEDGSHITLSPSPSPSPSLSPTTAALAASPVAGASSTAVARSQQDSDGAAMVRALPSQLVAEVSSVLGVSRRHDSMPSVSAQDVFTHNPSPRASAARASSETVEEALASATGSVPSASMTLPELTRASDADAEGGTVAEERRTMAILTRLHTLLARAPVVGSGGPPVGTATGGLAGREHVVAAALRLVRSPAATVDGNESPHSSPPCLTAEDRSLYLADPVYVTSAAVDVLLRRVAAEAERGIQERGEPPTRAASLFRSGAADVTESPSSHPHPHPPPTRPARVPTALPARLDMPLAERCAFCRKHDGMCVKDYRRWRARKAAYREAIARGAYGALPPWKRHAMLLLTAAYGWGSFAAMQLLREGADGARVAGCFLCPALPPALRGTRAVDLAALQGALAAAGAVSPSHVAMLVRNSRVLEAILEVPSEPFPSSSTGVEPLAWLDEATAAKLAHRAAFRVRLAAACGTWALHCGDGAALREAVEELTHVAPGDVQARWWTAILLLVAGAWGPCIAACKALQKALASRAGGDCGGLTATAVESLASLAVSFQRGTDPSLAEEHVSSDASSPRASAAASSAPHTHVRGSLPIRRLPFSLVRDGVLTYCDALALWNVHESTAVPLVRLACGAAVRALPPASLTAVLMRMPGFAALLADVARHPPSMEECAALHLVPDQAAVRPLGVLTTAADSFLSMTVRVSAVGQRAAAGEAEPPELPPNAAEVIVSRHFHLARPRAESPWVVHPVDGWSLDLPAMRKCASFLRTRGEG